MQKQLTGLVEVQFDSLVARKQTLTDFQIVQLGVDAADWVRPEDLSFFGVFNNGRTQSAPE
ncbi:hypothetical protein JYG30_05105 [Fibrella sp. USSR17]|nr:hypothetical protein A6C57_12665 [Fibrella sp. ES10-3-2-2]